MSAKQHCCSPCSLLGRHLQGVGGAIASELVNAQLTDMCKAPMGLVCLWRYDLRCPGLTLT